MSSFINNPSSKLPTISTSIFTVMSQMAKDHSAINLSQGFPNFPVSKQMIELVSKAMRQGHNQYSPMQGIIELREAIAEKVSILYGINYNPESEITITAGATEAIYGIISAFVNQGDEVIIFAPAYDSYDPTIQINGGKSIEIELQAPDFKVDWQKVKNAINDKTKMIIINTPHNPTGTILSKKDMQSLEALVQDTNIIILSDEVYEHIIFDDQKHQSAVLYKGLAERSFVVSSFGKTFHVTGWKTGYCMAPKELMHEFRKIHQFIVFSTNHPVQKAISTYIKNPENYLSLPSFFQKKRDLFLEALKGSKFSVVPSKGTYFQLLGYESISEESDLDFAIRLTKEWKIASIPISVFYLNNMDIKVLRFCFSKNDETLLKAAEIINRIGK